MTFSGDNVWHGKTRGEDLCVTPLRNLCVTGGGGSNIFKNYVTWFVDGPRIFRKKKKSAWVFPHHQFFFCGSCNIQNLFPVDIFSFSRQNVPLDQNGSLPFSKKLSVQLPHKNDNIYAVRTRDKLEQCCLACPPGRNMRASAEHIAERVF